MNLKTWKKVVLVLILFIAGMFLIRIYWTEIILAFKESISLLSQTRIRYVFLGFLVYVLSVYLFAIRWQKVLFCMNYKLKAADLFPILFGAIFINNLTPASRTGGEPLRILWANKRYGISYTDGFISILFERLVEIIPISTLLIYVLYMFPSLEITFLPKINALTLTSTYILLLTFLGAGIIMLLFREHFASLLKNVQQNWKMLSGSFNITLFLSSAVWVLDIIRLKLIALALDLHMSWYIIAAVSVLYLFLGILPITPGGLGIVEGGLVSLLLYFGLPLASAGSFVFLERIISFGLSSLIGFLCLFYYGGFMIWKSTKSQ